MIKTPFAFRAFPCGLATLCAALLAGCSGATGDGNTLASLRITDTGFQRPAQVEAFQCIGNQLLLIGRFDDGSEENLTLRATWSSSDSSAVQVSNGNLTLPNGDVLSKGALVPTGSIGDTAIITATFVGLSASQEVVVRQGSLEISPLRPTIGQDTRLQLFATAILGDGSPGTNEAVAFNSNVSWKVTGAAASVDADTGVVSANRPGTATVAAETGIACPTLVEAEVTISPEDLERINLEPSVADFSFADIAPNTSALLRLIGEYANGFTQDLTFLASVTSNSSLLAMSGPVLVAGDASNNVTAALTGKAPDNTPEDDDDNPEVDVVPSSATLNAGKRLDGLSVEPASVTLLVGGALDLNAIGDYAAPGTSQNLYRNVTWSSESPGTAEVNSFGRVFGLAEGTAVIEARYFERATSRTFTDEITVRVVERDAPPIASLRVDCPASVAPGLTADCRAIAVLTDASEVDVTFLSVWRSSDLDVAEVSNAHPELVRENEAGNRIPIPGRVFGHGTGTAVISATLFDAGGSELASDDFTISGTPPPPDADDDGVPDAQDQCPGTPAGESVNAQGCAASQLDADGDGVSDAADQCPGTPAGQAVNAQGCSASQRDTDGDGVDDATDQCAATPAGEPVNAVGCPDTDDDGVFDNEDVCPAEDANAGPGPSNSATRLGCQCDNVNPLPIGPRCTDP